MPVVRGVIIAKNEDPIRVLVMKLVGETPDDPQARLLDLFDNTQYRVVIETDAGLQDGASCGQCELEIFDNDVLTCCDSRSASRAT